MPEIRSPIKVSYQWTSEDFPAVSNAVARQASLFYHNRSEHVKSAIFWRKALLNAGPAILTTTLFSVVSLFKPSVAAWPFALFVLLAIFVFLSTRITMDVYLWLLKRRGDAGYAGMFATQTGIVYTLTFSEQGCQLSSKLSEQLFFWAHYKPHIEIYQDYIWVLIEPMSFVIPTSSFDMPAETAVEKIAALAKQP